jgi:hypothetical protein
MSFIRELLGGVMGDRVKNTQHTQPTDEQVEAEARSLDATYPDVAQLIRAKEPLIFMHIAPDKQEESTDDCRVTCIFSGQGAELEFLLLTLVGEFEEATREMLLLFLLEERKQKKALVNMTTVGSA